MNEPQDLSMSAASSVSSDQEQTRSSFTSPKKAFMMREAASRASSLPSGSGNTAPEVLVVATDQGNSHEVTVETTKPFRFLGTNFSRTNFFQRNLSNNEQMIDFEIIIVDQIERSEHTVGRICNFAGFKQKNYISS